ncbi:MAG: hypothetical protein ACD_29C00179G0001, partial [uncultured bacterium]
MQDSSFETNLDLKELPDHIQKLLVKRPKYIEKYHYRMRDEKHEDADSHGAKQKDSSWNSEQLKGHVPQSLQNKSFRYKGNLTKSQSMIIEKLCQYLTLTEQHTERIPKIQNGICLALSNFFILKQKEKTWDDFLNCIYEWDGRLETLTERLSSELKNLYSFTKIYYESGLITNKTHYLGDNAEQFFQENRETRVIGNALHAISIYPTATGTWLVYDPNYIDGPKQVSTAELFSTVKKALGNILSVYYADAPPIAPTISNPATFIAEGGLFTLMSSHALDALLSQFPKEDIYSRAELDGILLRHPATGEPAWVRALEFPATRDLTIDLLQYFIQHNRTDWKEKLRKSAELLTSYHLHEVMTQVIQFFPDNAQKDDLVAAVREVTPVNHYESRLATWHKKTHVHDSVLSFCKDMTNGLIKKRLIEFNSTENAQGLRFALEDYCHKQKAHHPIFYIHSPDDLVCAAAYIERVGNQGIVKKGPGGALYDFLTAQYDQSAVPILIVNYEKFHADDIVRLNALLDKKRSVDNIPLPDNMVVVGLTNVNNPECYQGSDFYSRFDITEKCPLSSEALQNHIPKITTREKSATESVFHIDLYHAQDWKNRLFGNWMLDNGNLIFKEGVLKEAFAQPYPIVIHNGLWNDAEFRRFWHEIERENPNREYILAEGYDWANLVTQCKPLPDTSKNLKVLNTQTFPEFFYQLHCDSETHQLNYLSGHIEQAKESTILSVLVTETLSDDEWARLIATCQAQQVTLQITHTENVTLPVALQALMSPIFREQHHPSVFFSRDVDAAAILLVKRRKNVVVMDVTDLHSSDLITRISGSFDKDTLKYSFEEKKRALLLELEKGNHVILKGHF